MSQITKSATKPQGNARCKHAQDKAPANTATARITKSAIVITIPRERNEHRKTQLLGHLRCIRADHDVMDSRGATTYPVRYSDRHILSKTS